MWITSCWSEPSRLLSHYFLGTEESPGEFYYQDGVRLKKYRGMGSIEAMSKGSEKRYFASDSSVKVAQGVSGAVVDKGSLKKYSPYLADSVRRGLMEIGITSVSQLHEMNNTGELRFELRTGAAQREGGIHSIQKAGK